jgi:hypothetical protein
MSLKPGLSLVALSFLLVLAGCSGGSSGPKSAARSKNPPPEEPMVTAAAPGTPGGRVVVSMLGAPKSFNAMMTNESATNDVISGAVWEGLLDFDNITQEVEPGLVSHWEHSADGLVWTMRLRKGLKWSDGHPLTTDDVLFTADVMADTSLHLNAATLLNRSGGPPSCEGGRPDVHGHTEETVRAVPARRGRAAHHPETQARSRLEGRAVRADVERGHAAREPGVERSVGRGEVRAERVGRAQAEPLVLPGGFEGAAAAIPG